MNDPARLQSDLQARAEDLRAQAARIAAELDRGPEARIGEIDILRPHILKHLAAIHQTLLACSQLPPQTRPFPLIQLADRIRAEAIRWPACDDVIRQQVPPMQRPLQAARGAHPSHTSTALTLLDRAAPWAGMKMSVLVQTLHGAHRVLLGRGAAGPRRFVHLGCTEAAPLRAASCFFDDCAGVVLAQEQGDWRGEFPVHVGAFDDPAVTAEADVVLIDLLASDAVDPVIAALPAGTLVILPERGFIHRAETLGCAPLMDHLYMVGLSAQDVARQKEAALFTGLALPQPLAPSWLWQEVFESAARRGFYASSPEVSFAM
ncbi:MAG: hypothetical protein AAF744_05155 [Pseudomonadota bacterium]